MQIVSKVDNFEKTDRPLFLALGNFDGVHTGHKKLIHDLLNRAKLVDGRSAVFIFEPHPAKILFPDGVPLMLVNTQKKARLLEKIGIDILVFNTFTPEIARWSPEEFVQKILINKLATREVFVGFNYSFGYKGLGNPDTLQQLGHKYGFTVNIVPPLRINGKVVSSTLIRKLLENGDIEAAAEMLGYDPGIEGIIIEGERRGSSLGFPTANIACDLDIIIPGKGVYAAVVCVEDKWHKAVVNIGVKPTFHYEFPLAIEAHIIDFDRDIYGKSICVDFIRKIRDEMKFNNLDQLVRQIRRDRDRALEIISNK